MGSDSIVFPIVAVACGLTGMPVSAGAGELELSVTAVRAWPGWLWTTIPASSIELALPENALLDRSLAAPIVAPTRHPLGIRAANRLFVFTPPASATFEAISEAPGTLSADRIRPG